MRNRSAGAGRNKPKEAFEKLGIAIKDRQFRLF